MLTDNALFSSAYGNVGSSIYYALGLVAALALGLTPLVFVIAGILFALTAATYTEATTMYPEAGGSSSFARHAFNETISFGAAWVQVMNFIITAAISALFVPHYLGFIWPALKEPPGDIIGGAVVILLLALLNIRGVREAARLNLVMAVTDLMTQLALVLLGVFVVLNFETLINNIHWGVAPTWNDLLIAVPGGDDRLHRDRDRLEHVGGGDRRPEDRAERDAQGRARGRDHLCGAARDRALGPAGRAGVERRVRDPARPARGGGRLRRRPGARRRPGDGPRRARGHRPRSTSACSRRRS